jgi:glycosyltransferase involved in cell wall biosynthesis
LTQTGKKPIRIGIVGLITIGGSSSGRAGGVETLIEEVSVRLVKMGHDVTVYCRARYNPEGLTEFKGVKLRNLYAPKTKGLEAFVHSFLSALCAVWSCDVIHMHSMGTGLWAWVPWLFGRKAVATFHGLDYKRDKWGSNAKRVLKVGERCALWFAHRITVVSRFLERHYREERGRKVTYIPNGVPRIPRRAFGNLEKWGLRAGRYVLYLSRVVPEKGVPYLIEAFKQTDTDMNLAIVGGARHAEDYLEKVKKLAADDRRIVFTGPLYGDDKEEAYSNAYLFCLPSDLEGLPIVLLEAMGAGRCCLTSDIPELVEVIDPVRLRYMEADHEGVPAPHGVTFRQGDVADLKAKLDALIASPEEVARLGENARRHAEIEYDWDRIAKQYAAVYEELLGRP